MYYTVVSLPGAINTTIIYRGLHGEAVGIGAARCPEVEVAVALVVEPLAGGIEQIQFVLYEETPVVLPHAAVGGVVSEGEGTAAVVGDTQRVHTAGRAAQDATGTGEIAAGLRDVGTGHRVVLTIAVAVPQSSIRCPRYSG